MYGLLWLIPVLPFAGFVILALFWGALPRRLVSIIGVGTVGLSALLSLAILINFLTAPPPGGIYNQVLWTWVQVGNFAPSIGFHLDSLSLVMIVVVTVVSFLIHLYSTEYMQEDPGYGRFFAYMNLFVGMMLILVMADNLLLLYLGWEGVGLCSYLLIGFWHHDPNNVYAARKAFVITRVGDTAMALGLFLLFAQLGTLNIQGVLGEAGTAWAAGEPLAAWAAVLLLGGAVGKSAQIPLQTWLPDAMAGPTPVSALIHAATMVTAGVYLIARMNPIFLLSPPVMLAAAVVGALTLLIAGFSALTQHDIKRVLAYSTISQIGYMFLALGVGAWSAAIFHFMTHAFFKALLFLGAGVIIHLLNEEHDMFKMGGLRRQVPVTFWTFLIGSASLAALPLVTAGFYSKDLILWNSYSSPASSGWLYAAGLVGAFMTSLYTFRMVFLTFYGQAKLQVPHRPSGRMLGPLVVLAALSILMGFVELPPFLGNAPRFSTFLRPVLPDLEAVRGGPGTEAVLAALAGIIGLAGIFLAWLVFLRNPRISADAARQPLGAALHRFWFSGWGFDWLYNRLFVWPYTWLAKVNKDDIIDTFYGGITALAAVLNRGLSRSQTGRVRWYALGFVIGAVVLIGIVMVSV